MGNPSSMAAAIAGALPTGCSIGCDSGRTPLQVLHEIVEQNKCASIVTNNPLAALLKPELSTTLLSGKIDQAALSIIPYRLSDARCNFQTDFALMTISAIGDDGELFAASRVTASAKANFVRNASKGVFLIFRPRSRFTDERTRFANVTELASRGMKTVLVVHDVSLGVAPGESDVDSEKMHALRNLSRRYPLFEVWSL